MFEMKRKGQGSAGASILVIVIAVSIIFYILFLPPDERAKLLDEDYSSGDSGSSNYDLINDLDGEVILNEDVGRLDILKEDYFTHEISSFSLMSSTESGMIYELNSALVSRSVFSKKDFTFEFDVFDKDLMENFLFSFEKEEGSGILTIYLNEKVLAEKYFDKANPDPIKLPKDMIVNGKNTVRFEVSSPGILFFLTNKYTLEKIRIFADTTDASGLNSRHTFILEDSEYENLESATVTFFTECINEKIGILNVKLNGYQIYNSVADCGNYVKFNLNKAYLENSENILEFYSDKGSYIIDQFKIRTDLKEPIFPVYYFEIDSDEMEVIEDGDVGLNLTIDFVEKDDDYNQVEISINNRKISIDTLRTYNEGIENFIEEDNNFIRVSPVQGTIDIVNMRIFFYEIDD